MNSWITIEVSIKFKDYLLENNTEQMNEFLEDTKTSIGESLGINVDNVKINMVKQEQPLWLDDVDFEEKAEA